MKERLLQIRDFYGLNTTKFEKKCGLSQGTINSMRKGLGYKNRAKVIDACPEISKTWLIMGTGSMLKDSSDSSINILNGENNTNCGNIPVNPNTEIEQLRKRIEEQDKLISKLTDIITNLSAK